LIKSLTRPAKGGERALLSFVDRWYDYTLSWMLRHPSPAYRGLRAMGDHDFSDQPNVRLFLGSVYESQMGPTMTSCGLGSTAGPDGCVPNPSYVGPAGGGTGNATQQALYMLRRVVRTNPDNAEAALRLGHALHIYNRTLEGRPHTEKALELAQAQHLDYLVYIAHMQLGDMDEHDKHLPEAIAHFRVAVALAPGTHMARVALGDALLRASDASGWAEARAMFNGESDRVPASPDPWFFYRSAQYWRVATGFRELREMIRMP
jgi:tetratricopeptide (TPR) repeat protein